MSESNGDGGSPFDSAALRTPEIIGRNQQVELIRQAIADLLKAFVIYITGVGGIGKTRLLEEIAVIQQNWLGEPFLWSNIIDLYHAEYHTPLGVQAAIIRALDSEEQYFAVYRHSRQEFEEKQKAGWSGGELEKLRSQLDQAFLDDYTVLAGRQRIVLTLDTVELLQYEVDSVQRVCEVPNVETVIKNWLLHYIPKLPNTVTLLAGRPQPEMKKEFGETFGKVGGRYIPIELDILKPEETQEYLTALGRVNPRLAEGLKPLMIEQIIKLARGRAIYIALLVDLFLNGGPEINVLYRESGEGRLDDKEVGNLLVKHLRALHKDLDLGLMVDYLAHARKGLDKALLRHLSGWDDPKIEVAFARMRQLAVVKTHRQDDRLFFHDHVYDIYDRYFLEAVPRDTALYTQIADYYKDKPDQASTIARLYYELQTDPHEGYHHYYARWDEEAIKSYEDEFDMRLRDEVLHFFNRYVFRLDSGFYDPRIATNIDQAIIHRDCAVRWVKRHLARGKNEEAIRIAKQIYDSQDPLFNWQAVNDPLYQAGLLTAWAEPMLYTNEPEEKVRQLLTEAIKVMADFHPSDENEKWFRNRILGRAQNNLGYLYWVYGRYGHALAQFRQALPKFQELKIEDEQADTLNNLGFLMSLLGRPSLAQNHIDRALNIRSKLNRPIPLAFSYNTRGYIYALDDHPIWGERDCRKALDTFTKHNHTRGKGLANNALGFTMRRHGNQWKRDFSLEDQVEIYFQQAINHLTEASTIFSKEVDEPIRLWEAYNELGSTLCDWGWFLLNRSQVSEKEVLEKYLDSIKYQKMALSVAEDRKLGFQAVDSYDDLAQICSDLGFLLVRMEKRSEAENYFSQAEAYLQKVEQSVPAEYHLKPGKGLGTELIPGDAYWATLGKVYYWRGVWDFRQLEYNLIPTEQLESKKEEATQFFITSCIYFQQFWPTSQALDRATDRLCRNLQGIKASRTWAYEQVQDMVKTYQIDLSLINRAIDDILGTEE